MKIVKILGGLGNQMFQYALYLALRKAFPHEDVRIDTACFRGYGLHNGFELEGVFRIPPAPRASLSDVARIAWPYPHYRLWQAGKYILPRRKTMCVEPVNMPYDATVLTTAGARYYDGYWQHADYFADAVEEVRRAYSFPLDPLPRNQQLSARIASAETASLHVRRGDYLKHPWYRGICDVDYYRKAIAVLDERCDIALFCIFTNDGAWCRENIVPLLQGREYVLVDWNRGADAFRDMQLMSLCHHNIIANSSFSWWAAWLNAYPQKWVVGPKKWLNMADYRFCLPKEWVAV